MTTSPHLFLIAMMTTLGALACSKRPAPPHETGRTPAQTSSTQGEAPVEGDDQAPSAHTQVKDLSKAVDGGEAATAFFTELPERGHWDRLYHCEARRGGAAWTFQLPEREQSPHRAMGRVGDERVKLKCKVRVKTSQTGDLKLSATSAKGVQTLTTVVCEGSGGSLSLKVGQRDDAHPAFALEGSLGEERVQPDDFECFSGPGFNPAVLDAQAQARLWSCPLGDSGERLHLFAPATGGAIQAQVTSEVEDGVTFISDSRAFAFKPEQDTHKLQGELPGDQVSVALNVTLKTPADGAPTLTGSAKGMAPSKLKDQPCQALMLSQ